MIPTDTLNNQVTRDTHTHIAVGGPTFTDTDTPNSHKDTDTHGGSAVGGPASPTDPLNGHREFDTHEGDAVEGPNTTATGGGGQPEPAMEHPTPTPTPLVLADPLLGHAAEILTDIEATRIANENRLRQLTRTATDSDGENRGFGLTPDDPHVQRQIELVAALNCRSTVVTELGWERPPKQRGRMCCLEHHAETELVTLLGRHPLAPWMAAIPGVGPKQGARLLAAIGDPYLRPELTYPLPDGGQRVEPARPRLISELLSYCGYGDPQAQRRQRGQRMRWNPEARMRAHNIAESIKKQRESPYRVVYDETRVRYADAVHDTPCVRCGPSGHPAPVGSPLSKAHNEARAYRAVIKALLADLWREAERLHNPPGDHMICDTQRRNVAGDPTTTTPPKPPGDHVMRDTHSWRVAGALPAEGAS